MCRDQSGPNFVGPSLAHLEGHSDVARHCGDLGCSFSKLVSFIVFYIVPWQYKTLLHISFRKVRSAPIKTYHSLATLHDIMHLFPEITMINNSGAQVNLLIKQVNSMFAIRKYTNILKAYATAASPFILNRGESMFWAVIVVC